MSSPTASLPPSAARRPSTSPSRWPRAACSIIGTDCAAIERAENRECFEEILQQLGDPAAAGPRRHEHRRRRPRRGRDRLPCARAPELCARRPRDGDRRERGDAAPLPQDRRGDRRPTSPCSSTTTFSGKEVEVDAICDGCDVFVPGIMELVERTGVHSGDSISVYPSYSHLRPREGRDPAVYEEARSRHRHCGSVQRPVHRRQP